MSRRIDHNHTSGPTLKHLFLGTALLGMVFGAGVIVGQRLMLEDGLPPLISIGEASPTPQRTIRSHADFDHESEQGSSIFSFYEVLTNAEGPVPSAPAAPVRINAEARAASLAAEKTKAEASQDRELTDVEDARYTLQVGTHPSIERARAEMDRLRALSLEPHVLATEVAGQGQFYRVRIGKFATMEQAQLAQRKLRAEQDVQTFVTPL